MLSAPPCATVYLVTEVRVAKRCKVIKRLEALGAVVLRKSKHIVWKMPDGARIVTSKTPSDHRSEKNALALIARWERAQAGT